MYFHIQRRTFPLPFVPLPWHLLPVRNGFAKLI
jgi:hypothetical protein